MSRKIIAAFLLIILALNFNYGISSAEDIKGNKVTKKVLINSYIMTWSEDGKSYYTNIDGNPNTHAEPSKNITVTKDINNIDLSHIGGQYGNLELVSVEAYDGTNFDFYDENSYWNEIPNYAEDQVKYDKNYLSISGQNINYSNSKLQNGKFSTEYSVTLINQKTRFNFAEEIKFGITTIDDIYNRFGGKNVVDPSMKKTLEDIKKDGVDADDSGYIYVIPTVITIEVPSQINIAIQNLNLETSGDELIYSADVVLLEGPEKLEKVNLKNMVSGSYDVIENGKPTGKMFNESKEIKIDLLEKRKPKKLNFKTKIPKELMEGFVSVEVNQSKKIEEYLWKREIEESEYRDNIVSTKFGRDNDLEVVEIKDTQYPANQDVSSYVKVRNNGEKDCWTTLNYNNSIINQNKGFMLKAHEEQIIEYNFKTPDKTCTLEARAEINPDKIIPEKNFNNNQKTITINIKKDGEEDANCSLKKRWTETDYRWETESYSCTSNGKSTSCSRSVKRYYTFEYEAKIDGNITIKDDRQKQKSSESVKLKSGYGFSVQADARVSWKQTSGPWSRTPKQKPSAPSTAEVTTSWKVSHIIKQPKTIKLQQYTSDSSATTFITPINPSSKTKAKVIYTDIDLEGTADRTKKHSFTVVVYANSPGGVLCKSITGNIEIFGDMYEDYRVN